MKISTKKVPKHIKKQEYTAALLAAIAAFTDTYAFLSFKMHVSFMSGNTTQTSFSVAQANFNSMFLVALTIFSFVCGIFFGTLFSDRKSCKGITMPYAVAGSLLLVYILCTSIFSSIYFSMIVLSFAMGYMNTAVTTVGKQAVNSDFVTGTLTNFARHLAFWANKIPIADAQGKWDTHKRRALQLLVLWCAFLSGALLGAIALSHLKTNTLLIPATALLLLFFAANHQIRRIQNNFKTGKHVSNSNFKL